MEEPSQSAKAIFDHALELPSPAEREAYLDQACSGSPQLRQNVANLLAAYHEAGSFLESGPSAGAHTLDQPMLERPGSAIGPYKLLQQIGEGGMGTVWMAEQTHPVQRKVALKVIKPGMDSRQVIARFEAERQALAMMDHVNIARVFDGGATENGRPYFVMELVHGVPITKYCDDNHLTPRERLELFTHVCHAVQHAHQKGIIHRDIKPSNVMVTLYDGKPVPKVIDFGVAKATEQKLTERTLFTQYGTMVGTLEYMSPEQAEMSALGVDTRSDIYSLGVLLYELLTGSTPLTHQRMKEAAYDEILRMIKEEEPPKPSTRLSDSGEALASISANRHTEPAKLTKLVRGELDWIVMKCLEKDRNRRYEAANGFAADVQRYLADEQVLACPPSVGYRLRKFARRNKGGLVVTALVLFFLVLLGSGIGWAVRDRSAREARTAIEVNQFLQQAESLYADNKCPEAMAEVQKARGVLEAGRGNEELGRRVRQWLTDLDTAGKLEEIRPELYDLEDRDREYADYARVFRDHGIDVEVLPAEAAAARVAASRIKLDLVLALGKWAEKLRFDPRPQEPARWQRLLEISRTADPDPWRLRLNRAVEAKDVQALRELTTGADLGRVRTRTLAFLGLNVNTAGDTEAAVAFLRKAQQRHPGDYSINSALASCLEGLKPPNWGEVVAFRRAALAARPQSASAHRALGMALRLSKRLDEAFACYHKAIELAPKYAAAHNSLGLALFDEKKLDEAIAAYRKAIELDPKLAVAYTNLGNVLRAQKKLDEAVAAYNKAIELDPKYAAAYHGLGNVLFDQKKLDEAVAAYNNAIELDPKYAATYNGLGNVLFDQKKLDEAVAACRKAIELDPKYAAAYNGLGNALCDQKKLDEAIAAYHKSIELDPKDAYAHTNLGNALRDQKRLPEAIAAYHKAIEVDPNFAAAYNNLGVALREQKKLDEAIAACHKAIDLDPKYAAAYTNLGNALRAQRKLDAAIAAYHKAIELDPKSAHPRIGLGQALRDQNKPDEAIVALREAIDLDPKSAVGHMNLGISLKEQGLLDQAIACYHKAIELEPNYALTHNNLGNALQDQGQLPEAIAAFHKAIELDPKDADAYYNLGNALRHQEQLPEAVAAYHKAIALEPTRWAYNNLGNALEAQGKLDEAAAAYRKAIELGPNYAMFYNNLGSALRKQTKLDEAVAAFRKAIELAPNFTLAYNNLGKALREQQKLDEAVAAYHKAIELAPDFTQAYNNLGQVLDDQQKYDEAIAAYRKAIDLYPKYAVACDNLGKTLSKQGKLDEAIDWYRKAIELEPKYAVAHNGLGHALEDQGKVEEAIASYRKAIEFDPKNANSHNSLGWALQKQGLARQGIEGQLGTHGNVVWTLQTHGTVDEAIVCYRKAIELDPKVAFAPANLRAALAMKGYDLANHPDPTLRDPKRAVELGKEAVELAPQSDWAWQNLGWIQYRAGNWMASIEALEKSCTLQKGGKGDAFQWLFLAMAHGQLGHKEEARKWYDKAIELERVWPERLRRFRAEAEELLGIKENKD